MLRQKLLALYTIHIDYCHPLKEIVPLRKICRRPETDYRLQQLHAMPINVNPQKIVVEALAVNTLKADAAIQKQQPKTEERVDASSITPTTVPQAGESKLVPSKAADSGNPNNDSSNTAALNTTVAVVSNPTLPQG